MIKLSEKRFLRPDEVAKLCNVAKSTVYGGLEMVFLKAQNLVEH
jgi:predicted DNA-binding transcriptional regulator AlpA